MSRVVIPQGYGREDGISDESTANAADPVLALVPEDRRDTLIAKQVDEGYRIDIHLQGPQETVFFDI